MFRKPRVAVDAIIEKDEKILLPRRSIVFRGKLALPGGAVEYGDRENKKRRRGI